MHRALVAPVALLFLALFVPSLAQSEASTEAPAATAAAVAAAGDALQMEGIEVWYDLNGNLTLTCDLPNPGKKPIVWSKNSTTIDSWADVMARMKVEDSNLSVVGAAKEDDFGNYACAVDGAKLKWQVKCRPIVKLPANTNVVEGQKLKVTCRVVGKPYPPVQWFYNPDMNAENGTELEATALGARAELAASEQGVEGAVLLVPEAALSDAGRLWCVPAPGGARASVLPKGAASTTLRVKDMYAALWPFLGICAEVFVLCAVILLYERRRAKPELDDSDTDQNDQKKS